MRQEETIGNEPKCDAGEVRLKALYPFILLDLDIVGSVVLGFIFREVSSSGRMP
jgi:hypothetical protein